MIVAVALNSLADAKNGTARIREVLLADVLPSPSSPSAPSPSAPSDTSSSTTPTPSPTTPTSSPSNSTPAPPPPSPPSSSPSSSVPISPSQPHAISIHSCRWVWEDIKPVIVPVIKSPSLVALVKLAFGKFGEGVRGFGEGLRGGFVRGGRGDGDEDDKEKAGEQEKGEGDSESATPTPRTPSIVKAPLSPSSLESGSGTREEEKEKEEKEKEETFPVVFELGDVTLEIPRGELWAIVGPVGSGKSSLLQGMIGGGFSFLFSSSPPLPSLLYPDHFHPFLLKRKHP